MYKYIRMAILITGLALAALATADEVNVYSGRKENLLKPLLDRFSQQTGMEVNLVTGKADALLMRLTQEGEHTPADVFVTVDAGRMVRAKEAGVLQTIMSAELDAAVPEAFRDPDGTWYGLSLRSRVIVYATERVDGAEVSTYQQLAAPQWRQRICVRSSDNIYNQSLVASMLEHLGAEQTEQWARGLVANFARPPKGGDRDQIKAVAAGQCDLALVNTYYLAGMLNSKDPAEQAAAAKVAIGWPDQNGRGAHMNVSGAGVTRAAKNRTAAIALLEFLVSDESQAWYAQQNFEYPVKPGIAISDTLSAWGEFKRDALSVTRLGERNAEAVRLMDRAGWR